MKKIIDIVNMLKCAEFARSLKSFWKKFKVNGEKPEVLKGDFIFIGIVCGFIASYNLVSNFLKKDEAVSEPKAQTLFKTISAIDNTKPVIDIKFIREFIVDYLRVIDSLIPVINNVFIYYVMHSFILVLLVTLALKFIKILWNFIKR